MKSKKLTLLDSYRRAISHLHTVGRVEFVVNAAAT